MLSACFKYLLALFFVFMSFSSYAQQQVLRIHGSNTVGASLVPKLASSWLQENGYRVFSDRDLAAQERLLIAKNAKGDQLSIEIFAHGSSTSFRSLAAGTADIGMSSRPIENKELKNLAKLGRLDQPDTEFIIAIDGLAVIVNKNNPLKKISKDKLKDIFSGKITNWSELGAMNGDIHVYARDNKSGTYDTFKNLVLDKKTPLIKSARRYESNARLSDDVAKDKNGIGFVGLAYVRNSRALSVSEPGAQALYPDSFNVATEDYLLSRRLFLYVPENNRHPLAEEFANYAKSDAGQKIAADVGFVSQQVIAFEKNVPDDAPEEFKEFTKNGQRLSLNIRFRQGMTAMDNKAQHDVDRLIHYMQRPGNKKKRLMLFGFSDANEVLPYRSLSVSIERADTVADKLLMSHLIPDRVRGYGHALPVSSNQTQQGRVRNRRVEIWIHDRIR